MTMRTCGRVVPFGVAEMEVGTSMFIGSAALASQLVRDTQPLECVFGFMIKRAAGTFRHFRAVKLAQDFLNARGVRTHGIGDVLIAQRATRLAAICAIARNTGA